MVNVIMERLDLNGRTSGKMKVHCPLCRDRRKDKKDKSVSVDLDKGVAYCHYCETTFYRRPEAGGKVPLPSIHADRQAPTTSPLRGTPPRAGGESKIDASQFAMPLIQKHADWLLKERAISRETLELMGVGSKEEWMPQTGKKEWCICFNYYEEGKLVNTKYRDLAKNFKMVAGAEVIPYNIDGIKGTPECIITEGEIDALSFAEIGRTDVISVPTGANVNLSWLDRFMETHFANKQVIYIAVDTDRKGQELKKELVRRLGTGRCRVVEYPQDCKDANELLVWHGEDALNLYLVEAREIPLEGVFTIKDAGTDLRALFEKGMERGAETGWENFDKYCTLELGRLLVTTGIPGAGKSEFVDELVMRLNIRHGWKAAFFSPENMPLAYHLRKLMEKATGARFKEGYMTEAMYTTAENYLAENYSFILPKEDFRVENILQTAEELVRRKGIKILSIDPFNRFEHQIPTGQTETQYISAILDKFTNFAVRNNCLVILVAHPRKMYKEPGSRKEPVPTLYDINGSAAFYNKCDFGLTVDRDYEAGATIIHIRKVKFRHLGEKGEATFMYNTINGRYAPCEIDEQTGKAWKGEFDNEVWEH